MESKKRGLKKTTVDKFQIQPKNTISLDMSGQSAGLKVGQPPGSRAIVHKKDTKGKTKENEGINQVHRKKQLDPGKAPKGGAS